MKTAATNNKISRRWHGCFFVVFLLLFFSLLFTYFYYCSVRRLDRFTFIVFFFFVHICWCFCCCFILRFVCRLCHHCQTTEKQANFYVESERKSEFNRIFCCDKCLIFSFLYFIYFVFAVDTRTYTHTHTQTPIIASCSASCMSFTFAGFVFSF